MSDEPNVWGLLFVPNMVANDTNSDDDSMIERPDDPETSMAEANDADDADDSPTLSAEGLEPAPVEDGHDDPSRAATAEDFEDADDYAPRADDEHTVADHDARDATEQIGRATFGPDETKTCRECGETTKATRWGQTGPTHSEAHGNASIQLMVLMTCPECGTHQ